MRRGAANNIEEGNTNFETTQQDLYDLNIEKKVKVIYLVMPWEECFNKPYASMVCLEVKKGCREQNQRANVIEGKKTKEMNEREGR